eukprot:EG_transcript_29592
MNLNFDVYALKRKVEDIHATVKGYPEIKAKVKVATNLDPWGPTREQMQEICEASYGYEDRRLITKALWKRITTSQSKEWPHIYKSLAVFEYLLLHGPEGIADEVREQLYNLKTLHDFHFVDEKGVDKGLAIREKSRRLVEWATDVNILKEERAKAAALQSKYVGISAVGGYSERTTNPRPSYGNTSSSTARPSFNPGRSNDVDALQANEEYVNQQKQ